MVKAEVRNAQLWLYSQRGPGVFRASLIPYTDKAVQFSHMACIFERGKGIRFMEVVNQEALSASSAALTLATARTLISNLTVPKEWQSWLDLHQRGIKSEYPRIADSEDDLYMLAKKESARWGTPIAMVAFGRTLPGDQEVAILYAHEALRIDRALKMMREASQSA